MLLRSSISNTRKFFQKTIDNFKSFFSNHDTYHKLPKTPNNPCMKNHHHHKSQNIIISSSSQTPSIHTPFEPKPTDYVAKDRALTKQQGRGDGNDTLISKPEVELVRRKLEEMEKMMNVGIQNDEEHASDVREFMHCYSRLRCAAYIDVVELFFMEVYSDFFSSHQPLENTSGAVRRRYSTTVS